jgi:hypothetical protein
MAGVNVFAKLDKALALPVENDPNVFSTLDYAQHAKIAQRTAHSRLSELLVQGVVERARICRRENGRLQVKDGWKFLGNSAETVAGRGNRTSRKAKAGRIAGKNPAAMESGAEAGRGRGGRPATLRDIGKG